MGVQLGSAYGQIDIDTSGAKQAVSDLFASLDGAGKTLRGIGGTLTAGVTAPVVGVAAAAVTSANEFNGLLANVQSLGVGADRVEELRGSVQAMSVDVGKSTSDLTGGLYQVISAFGDGADTVQILEINARAAAAGLATTEEAIALTSAVTKGYGDTSADAVQMASDLAFATVQLGQTTFPELASSMGKVVPLAATLGVSQEELAAQFATLTGVTGSASEVGTQLRATYQAILKPTADMGGAISAVASELEASGQLVQNDQVQAWQDWRTELADNASVMNQVVAKMAELEAAGEGGTQAYKDLEKQQKALADNADVLQGNVDESAAALGQSIVESVGYDEALQMLSSTAEGNTDTLGKMFGSVEALNAVLALSGPQADTYAEKFAAMTDVTGASADAFKAQTEGVNSTGFEMKQLQAELQVTAQQLGEALVPALSAAMEAAAPLIEGIQSLVTWFTSLNPQTQQNIIKVVALAAAIGPLVGFLGMVVGAITTLTPLFTGLAGAVGLLFSPVGIVLALVAGLAAVMFNWGGANEKVAQTLENWGLEGVAEGVRSLHEWTQKVVDSVKALIDGDMSFADFFAAVKPEWLTTLGEWNWPAWPTTPEWLTKLVDWAWPGMGEAPEWVQSVVGFAWPLLMPVAWVQSLVAWAWPMLAEIPWIADLVEWLWPKLEVPEWVSTLFGWVWPVLGPIAWIVKLTDWAWPSLNKPSWIQNLLDFRWPGFPSRPTWLGGKGDTEENAMGTNFFGGGVTWVGEQGPELIELPRGTKIFDNNQSMRMAGAMGGNVQISFNGPVTMGGEADVDALARRVVQRLRWAGL